MTTQQSNEGGETRSVDLIITDCRDSTWEKIPAQKRIQKDWKFSVSIISANGSTSFKNLYDEVARKSKTAKFEICTPDFIQITALNIVDLGSQTNLILRDKGQTKFPFTYKQKYSTVPHTRALTDQTGKFYGSQEHNPAAFALAELVDNALAATVRNDAERVIEIRFHEDGANSCLVVLDNGSGMNSETLRSSLKYKAPKVDRDRSQFLPPSEQQVDSPEDADEEIHPLYINSNISKFGAGLKQAVFWLGNETRIMTKTKDNDNVCEVHLSQRVMEAKELSNTEDPWMVEMYTGSPGQIRDATVNGNKIIKEIIQEEIEPDSDPVQPNSFTHIVIQNICQGDANSPHLLLRRRDTDKVIQGPSIETQLSHIYYYYLHGRNNSELPNPVQIWVKRFDAKGKSVSSVNLCHLDDENMLDLESRFFQTAAPDPFLFTIEVRDYNKVQKCDTNFKVGGIIRYHPFQYDRETNPVGIVARKQTGDEVVTLDDEGNSSEDGSQDGEIFGKSKEFFHIWWNGRLIPHTRLESFNWCSPGDRMKISDQLFKPYGRISGSLFFNSKISEITENKLNLTTTNMLVEMFSEKKIGKYQSTFQRVTVKKQGNNKQLAAKRMTPTAKATFEEWLKKCKQWDKQVAFSRLHKIDGIAESRTLAKKGTFITYEMAAWENLKLKVGSAVRFRNSTIGRNTPEMAGIVKCFLVEKKLCISEDGTEQPKVHAPLSLVEVELQPAPYYQKLGEEGSTRILEMRLIDTDTADTAAKKIIAQQLNDLRGLKLSIIEPAEPALDENGESNIPLDGLLLKRIAFDVTKEDGTSVGGHLPYYEGKSKRNIFMVARVHKINEDGTRVLFHTSRLCQYMHSTAYYFRNINLKDMMDLNEPGKFIITFRSYIEWNQYANLTALTPGRRAKLDLGSPPSSRRTSSVDSSTRPKTPSLADSNTRVVDPAYEIEWNQEVDSLGKKIFDVEDDLIRMPYHEIRFNIVAGPPHKFEIVEFGDEDVKLRIGQPFNIALSFKDSKGNTTYPTDWPPLLNQIPSISLVPNKKRPDSRLTFTSRELVVRAQDRQLVMVDVVASGTLLGNEFQKDCKVEVGLLIDQTLRKSSLSRLSFYPGTPVKIACSTNQVRIENGSKVRLACQVLDVCGNIITRKQNNDKPILLDCQISKYKDINSQRMELIYSYSILATSLDNEEQEMDQVIDLVELKTKKFPEMILSCILSLKLENSEQVVRPEPVQITVVPSTKPVKLKLYIETSGEQAEIDEHFEIKRKVNEKLHLSYKLFDCLDNEIPYKENEHKIKISWSEDIPGNEILPKLEIPKMAENKKKITTSLKISGNGEKIRHDFFLTSLPRKPAHLSVTFVGGPDSGVMDLPLGEDIPNLIVKLTDRYGNVVKKFDEDDLYSIVEVSTVDFTVEQQVVTDTEECSANDGSLAVEKLKICSNSANNYLPLGEITFTVWFKQQFQTTINLNVIPGPPNRLLLEINDEIQKDRGIFTIQNQSNILTCVRLIDVAKNTTKPMENMQLTLSLKSVNDLVVLEKPVRQKAMMHRDGNGTLNFDGVMVTVKKQQNQKLGVPCRVDSCGGKCYGQNVLIQVDAVFGGGKKISGMCYLHITCRCDIPSHLKIVNDGKTGKFVYRADSSFNYLRVTLEAEDGSKYVLAEKDHMTLILTRKDDPSGGQYECPAQNVREGVYTFGKVPTKSGRYSARFVYNNPTTNISIGQDFNEELEITCGSIHSLLPNKDVSNLSVSNDPNDVGSRVIVNDLILQVADSFGNVVQSAVGQLSRNTDMTCIEVQNHDQIDSPNPITNGQVVIPPLILPPNLILNENIKHKIRFTAMLQNHTQKLSYDLEFWFYNDARKLEEIRELKTKILYVEQDLKTSNSALDQVKQNLNQHKNENAKFKRTEDAERFKLSRIVPQEDMQNLRASSDIIGYENYLREDHQRMERERSQNKSNINSGPGAGEPDVLGPIGLLAEISSDGGENCQQIVRVLSWHLQSQLKVVVVKTEQKGHELSNRFPHEEFMVLDIIRDSSPTFTPLFGPGNPVYARSLLRFTNRDSTSLPSIQKVFNNILGKVIIIDDRPHATRFMKEYNSMRNGPSCPNILTRDGYLVRSSGIMGGSKNRIPENGNRFRLGLAPNPKMIEIQKIFQHLPGLKEAMVAREEVQVRNEPHIQELEKSHAIIANKTTDLKTKLDEMKTDLKTLTGGEQNQQRGILNNNNVDGVPTRRALRSSEANGRDEPSAKRSRNH